MSTKKLIVSVHIDKGYLAEGISRLRAIELVADSVNKAFNTLKEWLTGADAGAKIERTKINTMPVFFIETNAETAKRLMKRQGIPEIIKSIEEDNATFEPCG